MPGSVVEPPTGMDALSVRSPWIKLEGSLGIGFEASVKSALVSGFPPKETQAEVKPAESRTRACQWWSVPSAPPVNVALTDAAMGAFDQAGHVGDEQPPARHAQRLGQRLLEPQGLVPRGMSPGNERG